MTQEFMWSTLQPVPVQGPWKREKQRRGAVDPLIKWVTWKDWRATARDPGDKPAGQLRMAQPGDRNGVSQEWPEGSSPAFPD